MFARVVGAPSSRDAGTRDGGSGVARAKHPGVRARKYPDVGFTQRATRGTIQTDTAATNA